MVRQCIGLLASDIEAIERQLKLAESAEEYARVYVAVRGLMDDIDGQWKRLTAMKEQLAYEKIPNALQNQGIKSLTLKEGWRVHISPMVRASCRNMDKAIEWMKKNKLKQLVKETINASTLSAYAKDLMEREGKELPEEFFNVHFGSNTSLTKL